MATYKFTIPSFHIRQVRSAHTDTLFASTSLKVMNASGGLHRDWGANGVSLGDRKAGGGVDLNMFWENVDVPDPTPENPDGGSIAWTFLLANKGHNNSDFLTALNKLADAYAGALAGKSLDAGEAAGAGAGILYFLGAVAMVAAEVVINLLAADCDGMVASGSFTLTAAQLAGRASLPGQSWSTTENNPGTDSSGGCGENSNYDVNYQILQLGSQHVDLYAADANGTVVNAGQWVTGDAWQAGYVLTSGHFTAAGAPVTALTRTPDVTDLYVVRSDGSVWNAAWWSASANNAQWNAGYQIPGANPGFALAGTRVSAVARIPEITDLYVVRGDGSVWNAGWWAASANNGKWNAGYAIPGAGPGFAPAGAALTVVSRTPEVTDLYVVRSDGSVWNAGWWAAAVNNGSWNAGYAIPNAGPGFTQPGTRITVTSRH